MLSNAITNAASYAYNNPAQFLRYTAAGTYSLSTMMQAYGISKNKNIPEKEKSFLIPQELFNGALQLATFLTIATSLENWGRKLAQQGKIVAKTGVPNTPGFINGIAVAFSLIGTVLSFNLVTPLLRNPIAYYIQKKRAQKVDIETEFLTRPMIPSLRLNDSIKYNNSNPFTTFEMIHQTGCLPAKGASNQLNLQG